MDLELSGKVALCAGASKGIGFAIARKLAIEGARVSVCSRDVDRITSAAKKIEEDTQSPVLSSACDVTNPEQLKEWISESIAKWGKIDALLINTGGPPVGEFRSLSDEQWHDAFDLILLSAIRMIREVLPQMTKGGSILTITSYSIREPIERLSLSTVMRSGVAALVKTLSDELGPDGIRVNNIMPGRILTDRLNALHHASANRLKIPFSEYREKSISEIPLGRLGDADSLASAAAFLMSPAADYITGATLRVDGGLLRSI